MAQGKGLAIVTGAASGMGEAAARLMAEAGWPLLLCDLNAERLEAVAGRLGGAAERLAGDIAGPGFAGQLAGALNGRPVGALINCAGLSPTMADAARILDVNLAGSMRLLDAVRPHLADGAAAVMFASTAGHMLGAQLDEVIGKVTTADAVSSLMAVTPSSEAAYSVSKRGVQLLVRREAIAFGKKGARINSISPGIIDTPMGRYEMERQPMMKGLLAGTPLARMAQAEEVAAVAVFLCSPTASFVTGTDVLVDGGSMGAIWSGAGMGV
jgi:NAD(P)-dependent dehydrogenase (short-subunit alcohol dehydrogenase family)